MIGARSPRNCSLFPGMDKRFISSLNFLDPPWGPHSLVLSRLWGLFSRQLSGQCVNLTTRICLVPRTKMGGVFRTPKLGTQGFAFLHIFRLFRKLSKSDYQLHVSPSVRVEQFGFHWTNFHQIWYMIIFLKYRMTTKTLLDFK